MAAAEARAAWQRTANRCFVQEDAKRAPKLACVPPASSSSLFKQGQTDTSRPTTNGNGMDDFAPPTANSMYSNLSSDSRWWLHLQPNPSNYMYQKEQVSSTLEFVDIMDSESSVKGCDLGEESYEFVEMDSGSKQVDEFSLGSEFPHWMERETENSHEELALPWWHKDDLASFVAQRSQDFMENCDLPQPQSSNTSFTCFGLSKPQNSASNHGIAVSPLSTSTVVVDEGGEMDPSKRKLLEALCHSQTRAREAEKAAKQAYQEKQHVVKLIYKQASQLFAYKQWLYLLQLENLYNQIKANKIPSASPWNMPPRKKPPKRKTRGGPKEEDDDDDIIGKYAMAFAVGLGLVGAGLLLGWTVGWMFII
ncbi:unnamed protein product [Lactuca saligna]|uniref:Uncharacterized protein n=1 Tax=Lactuca saligna TaxID=75948 RepID=A0AA36EFZ3_LACSI|nr:unnamed protein product [Lactuca saligna]